MFFGKRFSGYHGGPFSGLDILVLSIIKKYNGISGYDVIQEINETFKDLWRASPGTIYPLLNRLAEKKYVSTEEIIDENNRQKKIYQITETGKNRLKEVIDDNLEASMNTLGDFIRTITQAWKPNEERINSVMACFPYHCGPSVKKFDLNDYSLPNIERVKKVIRDLELSKQRLVRRLDEIEDGITKYKALMKELERKRDVNTKTIEIVDDEEYNKF
jgi:DNA-binding PadR family transcriptional regulator